MPNQNECDHVVGFFSFFDDASIAKESDFQKTLTSYLSEYNYHEMPIMGKLEFLEKEVMTFNFCPDCGAKIDWEAIKESCDEH